MVESSYICLNLGPGDECQCCGGWIHADGCVPEGMPAIDGKFCSEECHDAIADLIERNERVVARYRKAREQ